jgi:hypothetical protein
LPEGGAAEGDVLHGQDVADGGDQHDERGQGRDDEQGASQGRDPVSRSDRAMTPRPPNSSPSINSVL